MAALRANDREIVLLSHSAALLSWDQETCMPRKAIDERSAQLSLLQGLIHERTVARRNGRLLEELGCSDENPRGDGGLPTDDRAFLRQYQRRYRRATRLPRDLVVKLAEKTSRSQAVWAEARAADDFRAFAPHLGELVELLLEVSDRIGYPQHPYDALLDEYEPFMLTSHVDRVFSELRADLVPLVEAIGRAPHVDNSMLRREFPVQQQAAFGTAVMQALGYELDRGRLDVSAHPFTTTLGADDVRITTRYSPRFFNSAVFGIIHEVGHALYELNIAEKYRGSLLAEGTSLGIHESQSRMWENMVGRSREFWHHFYPKLTARFPDSLGDVDLETFYRAINAVRPSLIRVEADEVSYGLHIILRFELEKALVSRSIKVADLPEVWRATSRELLGVEPQTDAEGVLQDIHWSMGAIGYFPTYALGNLYAAQFMRTIEADLPSLWSDVRDGEFGPLLGWLRGHIHSHGRTRTAAELCNDITGTDLSAAPFVAYLQTKYGDIYGVR
ncbi:MAG: carboxypeptidase M32 [Spirochaetaceae bacterium]|nr:MAG: carboxypeptidase M32 [Spirochaetaceae bacterium]